MVEVVMGGLPVHEDIEKFKKNVHIVVGSPGRLRHLIQDQHINVSSVRLLVLDEADKLMEKSFLTDINYIFSLLPYQKQIIMSSATYPEATKTFITNYVKCAQHVCPENNCVLLGVEQKMTLVKSHTNIVRQTQYKLEELLKILTKKQFKQCLIFCNYQARVYELYKRLNRKNWPVEQLCGSQDQSDRLNSLKTLQEYKCRILISTDLAGRGIDASNVDLVINFEPPHDWQTYLHRIGRAGRYGSYGMSITILSEGKEEMEFKNMLNSINLDTLGVQNFWESHNADEDNQDILLCSLEPTNNLVPSVCEVKYDEFWKTLISGLDIDRELNDFEVLCKSFEESKPPEIESFADLMNSYKTNEILALDKNDNTYQFISLNKSKFKDLKSLKSNNESLNCAYTKPIKTNLNIDDNDNELSNLFTYKNFHKENNKEKLEKQVKNDIKESCLYLKDLSLSDIEVDSSGRALMNAGLPLSFGSSKNSSNFNAVKDKSNKAERKYIKGNYIKKDTNTKDSFYQHKIQESFDGIYNTIKYTSKVGGNNKRKEANINRTYEKQIQSSQNDSYSQNYINWYRQLKARVKHIELAIYIDEISKL